jgi:hypothetical protein
MMPMSNPPAPTNAPPPATREEIMSALFAHMVIQQTNMALMLLGKVPHPETGEIFQDVESAKMFIDQLEMLEVKTKGNLDARETGLLKQGLTALRMAFVELVEGPAAASRAIPPEAPAVESAKPAEPVPPAISEPAATAPSRFSSNEAESQKKFSKKY